MKKLLIIIIIALALTNAAWAELPKILAVDQNHLMGATGNLDAYLQKIKDAGGTHVRFFAIWLGDEWKIQTWQPFRQLGVWNPWGLIGEPGMPDAPYYDLTKWDDAWWEKLDYLAGRAHDLDLTLWVVLEDGRSMDYEATATPRIISSASISGLG